MRRAPGRRLGEPVFPGPCSLIAAAFLARAVVEWRGIGGMRPVAALVSDIVMSILLDMCRMNGGASLRPLAVSLRRHQPEGADAYERFYGCPVRFGADDNVFVLRAEDADRPLPTSNRQLAAVFDRMLTEELARLDRSDVVARCRASVLEHLVTGELSEEQTAIRLHMSPRSLQRKLAEAETTCLKEPLNKSHGAAMGLCGMDGKARGAADSSVYQQASQRR